MEILSLILFILFYVFNTTSQQSIQKLDLFEGDTCQTTDRMNSHHTCQREENCPSLAEFIKNRKYLNICSFDGSKPIFCCPPNNQNSVIPTNTTATRTVGLLNQICTWTPPIEVFPAVYGGELAKPMEFKHMALLGSGETLKEVQWGCGGSLITQRWILSAAHCNEISFGLVRWARLGDLNTESTKDDARPIDYRIERHVLHPDYKPPSLYNDIALFRLDGKVYPTKYHFPVCINSDQSLNPSVVTASGWGRIGTAEATSAELLKVDLDVFPVERCNTSYSSDPKLKSGIWNDRMICAGSHDGSRDTCTGDSGGPIQIINPKNTGLYDLRHLLIGITSFGRFCGDKDTPGVYTRVSYYYPWIASIVFD